MKSNEVGELINIIGRSYHNVSFERDKVQTWYSLLRNANYEKSKSKLLIYIESNRFPPTISDFIVKDEYNPASDYYKEQERARQEVEQEKNDPEAREKRKELLERMEQMKRRLEAGDSDE
ncbi:hypothetical protein [Mammaliicoccus sciuri]|uniref:hypothetical protein n=1 Tax=Mammaliicoccus sciuri TaxID=1296 RepID=UPI003F5646DA